MIRVDGVKKYFHPAKKQEVVKAVDGVSLQAEAGRTFAVLGPNGSGKTTLLRMLATMLQPDEGSLSVAGFDSVTEGAEVRKRIGFLTGSARLHKRLTGRETLDFFGGLYGIESEQLKDRQDELIAELDMGSFVDRPIEKLSMGQQQRVMIARTLLHDPEIVVFDEATAGLDVLAAKTLMDIMKQCREAGKTVLFATHIMGEVSMLADDVMILHKGKSCFTGTFEELKAQQQADSLEEEFVRLLGIDTKTEGEACV